MNDKIRELIKQMDQAGLPYGDNAMTVTDRDLEYFAELIVKECADVAWMNTPETEELEYSHLIKDKILKHFGVEE